MRSVTPTLMPVLLCDPWQTRSILYCKLRNVSKRERRVRRHAGVMERQQVERDDREGVGHPALRHQAWDVSERDGEHLELFGAVPLRRTDQFHIVSRKDVAMVVHDRRIR